MLSEMFVQPLLTVPGLNNNVFSWNSEVLNQILNRKQTGPQGGKV
jgi:hypothetical protein